MCLASDPARLIAAEGRARGDRIVGVDPHASRLDAAADPYRAVDVARPDRSAEAVGVVVGHRDDLFLRLEFYDAGDGAEDLLLRHFHVVCHIDEQGRRIEGAVRKFTLGERVSAAGDTRALRDAHVDALLDLLDLVFVYLAAHLALRLPRHTDFDFVEGFDGVFYEFVVDVLMYEYARAGAADLPLVEEDAELQAVHRHIPFAVGEVDVRRFAAQFERRGDQAVRRRLGDVSADVGRAGEGQFPESLMLQHELSGF